MTVCHLHILPTFGWWLELILIPGHGFWWLQLLLALMETRQAHVYPFSRHNTTVWCELKFWMLARKSLFHWSLVKQLLRRCSVGVEFLRQTGEKDSICPNIVTCLSATFYCSLLFHCDRGLKCGTPQKNRQENSSSVKGKGVNRLF